MCIYLIAGTHYNSLLYVIENNNESTYCLTVLNCHQLKTNIYTLNTFYEYLNWHPPVIFGYSTPKVIGRVYPKPARLYLVKTQNPPETEKSNPSQHHHIGQAMASCFSSKIRKAYVSSLHYYLTLMSMSPLPVCFVVLNSRHQSNHRHCSYVLLFIETYRVGLMRYLRTRYTTSDVTTAAPSRLHITMAATAPPLRPPPPEVVIVADVQCSVEDDDVV